MGIPSLPGAGTPAAPDRIGAYRLLSVLGEGGMGVVYLAEQTEPVQRHVALKVLRPGTDTRQVVARFEAERQLLAVMEHPGIARIYDAGETDAGLPYFVMERVDGMAITDYCDRERLDLRARVRLFTQVCRAVQHAHQKAVIHRDLKPSNVLVTQSDGEPLCKVIDFGIARALEASVDERLTQVDQSPGTPAYMSPEQLGGAVDVDTRSDIYSLSVVLYELLAGVLPFDPAQYRGVALHAQVLTRDAAPLGTRFGGLDDGRQAEIAARRGTDPATLKRALCSDLQWIVARALEKDRDRRYETANGFALDLERFLAHQPVAAIPPGRAYRARKFVRRHRAGVAFAVVLVLLLVGFAAAMTVQAGRVARARDLAQARQAQAEDLIDFMVVDLREKLAPVGRLDILDDIGAQALAYFAAVPESELSDDELFRRVRALRQLGDVRLQQGNRASAGEVLQHALGAALALVARDTLRAEWQLILSSSHFSVGYVHWQDGDLSAAAERFAAQRGILERLAARDSANHEIRQDLSRAWSNLGSVQEARGDLEGALASFRSLVPIRERLAAESDEPRNARFSLAIALNKLAVVEQKLGRFEAAEANFRAELALKQELAAEHVEDAPLRADLALAQAYVGRNLIVQGRVTEAIPVFETAAATVRDLVVWDAANEQWRASLGNRLIDLGSAHGHTGDRIRALTMLRAAAAQFDTLLQRNPRHFGARRSLALSARTTGRVELAHGNVEAALAELQRARRLYEQVVGERPDDRPARAGLAETLLLAGDAHAARGDTSVLAAALWLEAQQTLEPLAGEEPEMDIQALWSAALLRNGDIAAARTLASALRERGYREPTFVKLTSTPSRS